MGTPEAVIKKCLHFLAAFPQAFFKDVCARDTHFVHFFFSLFYDMWVSCPQPLLFQVELKHERL